MTRVMLMAVLDTLLPGDNGAPPLPAASEAALDTKALERLVEPLLAALGDADQFLMAKPADRALRLRAAEQAAPDAFKALLAEALAAYYESPSVLTVLGWRAAPPQPQGHSATPTSEATLRLLDAVKSRGQLWRA